MAFSAGVYTLPGAALSTGDTVSATDHNQVRNDMATAFNLTWLRNGTATATANIPMGGFKLTGLAAGTTAGDAVRYEQFASPPAIGSGTANTGAFTTLTSSSDATLNGLTVGKGAGAVSTNTAVGASALAANTTGANNVAVGNLAMVVNTTGTSCVGIGDASLRLNSTGNYNVAVGQAALRNNDTASNNTAVGYQAGYSSTAASNNFVGYQTGYNCTGSNNTFIGTQSGYYMTTGNKNVILGNYNGLTGGGLDLRTSSNYVVLSDGDGNPLIYIQSGGDFKCPTMYTLTTANAANMYVFSDGSVRRSTSALKYKQDVRDLENIDIDLFRAVRYKSKSDADDQSKDHFGVIADEVDAAGITELVNYGADGEVEGFQYERLTVVLLKEVQRLKAEVAALKGN